MSTKAYRLTKSKHADTAFSGEGARLYGGRWSPPGISVVYLADSLPLAVLETLVHLERPQVLDSYVYFEVSFESDLVLALDAADLPEDWRSNPEPVSAAVVGAAWARDQASLLLQVPSAVIPQNHNYLLNPAHPDREKLTLKGPMLFDFDSRLV
ncbi:MAG: RES family NAD+ phosphorylase [Trueperaceae bacterium]